MNDRNSLALVFLEFRDPDGARERSFFVFRFVAEDSVLLNCLARFFPTVLYSDTSVNEDNSFRNHIR